MSQIVLQMTSLQICDHKFMLILLIDLFHLKCFKEEYYPFSNSAKFTCEHDNENNSLVI